MRFLTKTNPGFQKAPFPKNERFANEPSSCEPRRSKNLLSEDQFVEPYCVSKPAASVDRRKRVRVFNNGRGKSPTVMTVLAIEKGHLFTCVLSVLVPAAESDTGLPWQHILDALFPAISNDPEFSHYLSLASISEVKRAKGEKQFDVRMFNSMHLPFHEIRTLSHYIPAGEFRLRYFHTGGDSREDFREHSEGDLGGGEVVFMAGEPELMVIPEDHLLALHGQGILGTWWLRRCADLLHVSAYEYLIGEAYSSDCTVWKYETSAYSHRQAAERIKKFLDPFELQMLEVMEAALEARLSLVRLQYDGA